MASSGSLQTGAYTYSGVSSSLIFSWTQTGQDTTNNTTTISWTLKGARKNSSTGASESGWYETGPVKLTVDGVQWYYFSTAENGNTDYEDRGENTGGRIEHRDGVAIASGTHTFSHKDDGTRSFSVSLNGECYTHDNNLETPNMSGSTTFYLNTINRNYTVYYNANGGSGSMSSSTATYNTAFMTKQNAFTRAGHSFNGWNESSDGTGVAWNLNSAGVYESGNYWTWTYTKDITLYAQWKIHKYTIRYDANTGTGAPGDQSKTYNVSVTLSSTKPTKGYTIAYDANGGSVNPSSKNVSCTFNHWDTAQNGSGNDYASGASFNENGSYDGATITLYAQWSNPTAGTLPTPTRPNYVFVGWFDAYGNQVTDATTITSDITLYAHWVTSKIYIKTKDGWIPWIPPGTTPSNVNSVYKKSGNSWTKTAPVRKKSGNSWNNLE